MWEEVYCRGKRCDNQASHQAAEARGRRASKNSNSGRCQKNCEERLPGGVAGAVVAVMRAAVSD